MTLGDLGADVIKVERPDARRRDPRLGTAVRRPRRKRLLPQRQSQQAERRARPRSRRRRHGSSRALIARGGRGLDNFRPGTLERRGLDVSRAARGATATRVVHASPGFGADERRPGYDFVVQAESGWMAITGEPDGATNEGRRRARRCHGRERTRRSRCSRALAQPRQRPTGRRAPNVRLARRQRRRGARERGAEHAASPGRDAARWGNAHPNLVPYQLFDAADRPIVIAVGTDAQWRSCARALGLDRSGGRRTRSRRTPAGLHIGATWSTRSRHVLATQPAVEWLAALAAAGVPAGIVRIGAGGAWRRRASPLTGVAPNAPGTVRLPPPMLDEHGALVRELGWDAFDALSHRTDMVASRFQHADLGRDPRDRRQCATSATRRSCCPFLRLAHRAARYSAGRRARRIRRNRGGRPGAQGGRVARALERSHDVLVRHAARVRRRIARRAFDASRGGCRSRRAREPARLDGCEASRLILHDLSWRRAKRRILRPELRACRRPDVLHR